MARQIREERPEAEAVARPRTEPRATVREGEPEGLAGVREPGIGARLQTLKDADAGVGDDELHLSIGQLVPEDGRGRVSGMEVDVLFEFDEDPAERLRQALRPAPSGQASVKREEKFLKVSVGIALPPRGSDEPHRTVGGHDRAASR